MVFSRSLVRRGTTGSAEGEGWVVCSASVMWLVCVKMFFSGLFEAVNNLCMFWRFQGILFVMLSDSFNNCIWCLFPSSEWLEIRDLLFSQRYFWRVKPSEILHRVDWRAVTFISADCLTLKMKSLRSVETSVTVYHSKRRNIPEDLNFQYRGDLKR
jgi:hypothetical protein